MTRLARLASCMMALSRRCTASCLSSASIHRLLLLSSMSTRVWYCYQARIAKLIPGSS